uniref:Transposase n=1 Tax=Globodera pallida TaxID=36090 RepID=A0A183CTD7_GLOPA
MGVLARALPPFELFRAVFRHQRLGRARYLLGWSADLPPLSSSNPGVSPRRLAAATSAIGCKPWGAPVAGFRC